LTLRWVRSNHYCLIEILYYESQWIEKAIANPLTARGQEPTISAKRNLRRYAPFWHLYIGHYDAEKYKMGRLKSRPNGRRWCKVRYNPAKEEAQSDLDILMVKYNFTLLDLRKEEGERKTDFLLKREM
jgi:hypothetical protein